MIRHSVVTARAVILALPAVLLLVLGVAPPAAAEPAHLGHYPGVATATRLTGYAFDRATHRDAAAWAPGSARGIAE